MRSDATDFSHPDQRRDLRATGPRSTENLVRRTSTVYIRWIRWFFSDQPRWTDKQTQYHNRKRHWLTKLYLSNNIFTMDSWSHDAAIINGDGSKWLNDGSTSAPLSIKIFTVSKFPFLAAKVNGVAPKTLQKKWPNLTFDRSNLTKIGHVLSCVNGRPVFNQQYDDIVVAIVSRVVHGREPVVVAKFHISAVGKQKFGLNMNKCVTI